MGIERQRKNSIKDYINSIKQLVEELEPIMLEKPQYVIEQHIKKLRDKFDEITNV